MGDLLTTVFVRASAFAASNVDDLFVLTLLFSQTNATFRRKHIVWGQYLGFTALVVASLPGFVGGLWLPQPLIEVLGLIPIALALGRLTEAKQSQSIDQSVVLSELSHQKFSLTEGWFAPQTFGIAAIIIANGSDNLAIYVPLFSSSDWTNLSVIVLVFLILMGLWCAIAERLTKQSAIARTLARSEVALVLYVLVGLGSFVFWRSFLLTVFSGLAVYLCVAAFHSSHRSLVSPKSPH